MVVPSPARPRAAGSGPRKLASHPEALVQLARFPLVAALLRGRGVELARADGESDDAVENRIGTELMALYRDTANEQCFEALYAVAKPALLHWIRGLLCRGLLYLDPGELLQDTFVNVFRYPKGFREDHPGSFRVWVRTIAGNIVRRARSQASRLSLQALPEGLQEPADPAGTPEVDAVLVEQRERLRVAWMIFLVHYAQAWGQLRDRDRRALELVEVRGLSYAEAGALLDVGRSNMKMIVFRSRKRIAVRMRAAMGALGDAEPAAARLEAG